MRQRTDHALGGATGQFGISVESDDETHAAEHCKIHYFYGKTVVLTAQQPRKIHQLTALALPTHPDALARVIHPMAVREQKHSSVLVSVLLAQLADQVFAESETGIILARFFARVGKIGEQSKVKIGVTIGKIQDFQLLSLPAYLGFIQKQDR